MHSSLSNKLHSVVFILVWEIKREGGGRREGRGERGEGRGERGEGRGERGEGRGERGEGDGEERGKRRERRREREEGRISYQNDKSQVEQNHDGCQSAAVDGEGGDLNEQPYDYRTQ